MQPRNGHGDAWPKAFVRAVQQTPAPSIVTLLNSGGEVGTDAPTQRDLLRALRRTGAWLRDRHRPVNADDVPEVGSALDALDRLPTAHEVSLRRWDKQLRNGDAITHGPMSLHRVHLVSGDGLDVVVPAEPARADPAVDVGGLLGDCAVLQVLAPGTDPGLIDRLAAAFRSGYDGMLNASPIDELILRRAIAVHVAAQIEQQPEPDRIGALAADLVETCWRLSA